MNKTSKHFLHGGDIDAISKQYGLSRDEIIDFSGNINPLGISPIAKEQLANNLDLVSTYPDRNYVSLRKSISKFVGIDMEHILVGNGSTELISLMIQLQKPKELLIIGPTYSEYEREANLSNSKITYFPLNEKDDFKLDVDMLLSTLTTNIDMLIICNPNNPTSTSIHVNVLDKIVNHCKENDIFVMIDETYVEFVYDMESVSGASLVSKYDNMLILRGISKFFSSPGLRLGYGLCSNKALIKHIDKHKNPWAINILASFATEVMLTDTNYINKTKELFNTQRDYIYNEMKSWKNIKVYKPDANFILFKLLNDNTSSGEIFDTLIQQNMLIRDASSFPFLNDRFLRFCFLLPRQNQALLDELKKQIEKGVS